MGDEGLVVLAEGRDAVSDATRKEKRSIKMNEDLPSPRERIDVLKVGILHLFRLILTERVSSNGGRVPGDEGFEVREDRSGDAGVVRRDDLDGVGPVDLVSVVVLRVEEGKNASQRRGKRRRERELELVGRWLDSSISLLPTSLPTYLRVMGSRDHDSYSSSESLDSERNQRGVNETFVQDDLHSLLEKNCSCELSPSSRVVSMIVTDDETFLFGFRVRCEDVGCETLGARKERGGRSVSSAGLNPEERRRRRGEQERRT